MTIVPVEPGHIPELGRICFEAFGALQSRHGVERDFDSPETAGMVVGMFATRPDFAGFVAIEGGKPVGSNFISFSDPVSGVGPITVDPRAQSQGVGKALMLAVMNEAERRGVKQVRLMQEAINTTSLSLYTKLGFDWRDGCAMMRPAASAVSQSDELIRPATDDDLPVIDRLSTRHCHASRVNEVAGFFAMRLPGWVIQSRRDRTITGYYFPGMLGHGFAATTDELAALITYAARHAPPPFLKVIVPLSESELHRTLLARGCRTIKLFNYMTTGEYRQPVGAWVPSIGM